MAWTPLAHGNLAARAHAAISDIVTELVSGRWVPDVPGIAAGLAGHALGYEYLSRALRRPLLTERARDTWAAAGAALESTATGPWLYAGFPGVAWATAQLLPRLFPDEEDPLFEEIDGSLLAFLRAPGRRGECDLVSGVAGLAVYGLERMPSEAGREILVRVVGRLAEAAEPVPGCPGRAWHTPADRLPPHQRAVAPHGLFNLGVAHGMPAIVALLAAIAAAGVEPEQAGALADDGLAWIWSQESRFEGVTRFASWIAAGEDRGSSSRIAWCYGDLGMSLALAIAARLRGNTELTDRAIDLARHAARVRGDASGVRDAGLCHGSAGNALVLARLAHLTACEELADAARFWTEHTLTWRRTDPIAGFPGWRARDPVAGRDFGHFPDAGVLTGAMGVAMVLAAMVTKEEPAWDRFLVASVAASIRRPG